MIHKLVLNNNEVYIVGSGGVTSIIRISDTIRVFKDKKLYSEHSFINVIGIYYEKT